jgi:leucyl-tRNA---protein transferase
MPPHPMFPATAPSSALPPPVRVPLVVVPEHPCPYLPGRVAMTRAFAASSIPGDLYHQFMDANFRRSGTVFYQPVCRDCRSCMQIRVPTDRFTPTKSQRRTRRKNADVSVSAHPPGATDEKFELYKRYLAARHGPTKTDDRSSFELFLYDSPVETIEMCYRDRAGKLLAVGICDVSSRALSSVYFYFDPAHSRRGLGTFGALHEIDFAREMDIAHYYLGYWIKGCETMDYKALFRPCEVLQPDGTWHELPSNEA